MAERKIFLSFISILSIASYLWFHNALYSQSERYLGKKITKIEFKGNENIKDSELMNVILSRPGMTLTRDLLNDDLKSLFGQGGIEYARVEGAPYKNGVSLLFIIKERPIVGTVSFRGLKELSENNLTDLIPLKSNKIFSEKILLRSLELVRMQFREKGLFNAFVRYEKVPDDKRKNAINVVFIVDEGEEIKIGKINIIGVKVLSLPTVYGVLKQQEDGIFTKGDFKERNVEQDKQNILNLYNKKGFLDARVVSVKKEIRWKNPVKKDKRVFVITYEIEEGERSYFNGYDVQWDEKYLNSDTHKSLFTKKKIQNYFEQSEGYVMDPFNQEKFNHDRGIINYLYNEKGYIYARSIPEKTVIRLTPEEIDKLEASVEQKEHEKDGIDYYNIKKLRYAYEHHPEKRGKKFIQIKFVIQEGIKGYIENIIIKGNEKTADNVIRREFLLKEGELFNAELIQRSREKIYNLGYFSEVNLDARPGSKEGLLNIIITVTEQLTGSMSVGGGYGTLSGFSIFMQLAEKNLNGTGQELSGKIQFGLTQAVLNISWTEPWLFGKPWGLTLGAELFHTQLLGNTISPLNRSVASYSTSQQGLNQTTSQVLTAEEAYYYRDKIGFTVQISHKLGLNWVHYHGFNPSFSLISNPSSRVDDLVFLEAGLGWQFQNRFMNGIVFDNRDNVFNTTQGFSGRLSADFVGGIFGGSDHYNRYSVSADFYWWPTDFTFFNLIRIGELRRWRIVITHHLSGTFTQQSKPVWNDQDIYANPYIESYDRLFLGGFEGLRGYQPFDPRFPSYWNLNGGASHRLLFDTELRIPVEPSLLWLVLYFDMGALFNDMNQFYTDSTTAQSTIDAIKSTEFTVNNIFDLSYYRYSWGFGFRLQIPALPIRLYFAQRLLWDKTNKRFINDPTQSALEVVFAIGDYRF